MLDSFAKLEANTVLFRHQEIPFTLIENIQRQSLLKSSLFSAKIEGNTLTADRLEEILEEDSETKEMYEVANILSTLSHLKNTPISIIDRDSILKIHKMVMNKLIDPDNLGKFRKVPSAIFNESGFPVYIPPPASEVPILFEELMRYVGSNEEKNIPIKASMAHYIFERIHPFLDGNGRVERLLFEMILAREGYNFQWLLTIEEILNERKSEYYAYLDESDPTQFIEFMLDVMAKRSEQIITEVSQKKDVPENTLLPRRSELLLLIRDHQVMSLDSIQRRFFKVPERTLRYDLKQLEKSGYITKMGTTRGVVYKAK